MGSSNRVASSRTAKEAVNEDAPEDSTSRDREEREGQSGEGPVPPVPIARETSIARETPVPRETQIVETSPRSDSPMSPGSATVAPVAAAPKPDPTLRWVLLLQIVLVGGLGALGYLVFDNRSTLSSNRAGLAELQHLAEETRQLAQQHEGLKNEIVQLRGFVASRMSEDVIFLKIMIAKPRLEHEVAREIARHVRHYASVYGQDPDLVLAMIDIESDFDPNIVSHMGAVGLMQVMPQWKRVLGIQEDLEDIETSIKYGLQILGFYREMYKDLDVALTAYNRGPGAVDAALMRGRDPKNNYAPRVLERYAYFRALNMPPS